MSLILTYCSLSKAIYLSIYLLLLLRSPLESDTRYAPASSINLEDFDDWTTARESSNQQAQAIRYAWDMNMILSDLHFCIRTPHECLKHLNEGASDLLQR
ncbi:hypothetical protein M501DRAFT_999010 [Patellaria atrata CBS 101060]|uniref:Uncharacterized protein n=1 Tax=Patellaria atrata CBS 101060 TaxID=1346257 RepID=A0A9P4S5B4_9PEZI|nr:hypothetical protein M501DRAFT_999010 [Patellaria atrata CBS 101060]